jgi:hypothetical protein
VCWRYVHYGLLVPPLRSSGPLTYADVCWRMLMDYSCPLSALQIPKHMLVYFINVYTTHTHTHTHTHT